MEAFIWDQPVIHQLDLYKHRFGWQTTELFSSAENLRLRSRFVLQQPKTKNPAGARFLSTGFAGGSRRTHCVTSTVKVYAIAGERAIFGTDFDVLSMVQPGEFVQKILFMHTVFIYNEPVHFVRFGGRMLHGRNEVLAETGGAVSALPLREHTVLRQQRGWLQAVERYANPQCSFT
ncbi:hypothetical protein [Trabulsiella odontotermitis]|uniref:hypothetical protein n=1 Tax=Trabulsiella odontotermitis TaxID=379893 RepID=UPI003D2DEEE2